MRRTLFHIAIAVGVSVGVVTTSCYAQTTASGPYYATPSWDQQFTCATVATCTRFIVLSNWVDSAFPSGGAAVLDRETGLVWQRSPETSLDTQGSASVICNNEGTGGRASWRLPSYQELGSLFEHTGQPGRLPAGHPFQNLQAGPYWTYTLEGAGFAWLVDFRSGINIRQGVSNNAYFICVRGGAPGSLTQ
jgi:hypothetical protein